MVAEYDDDGSRPGAAEASRSSMRLMVWPSTYSGRQ
jgi:hypothetical protein